MSDISLASAFWTPTLFLPPDYRPLPNPRIPWHESVFPALTQFLSLDHHSLPVHWVCKPGSPCDIILLSPNHCTEELKFTFRILPRILKRTNISHR
ncbi:hypothetical protein ATANTOWER_018605 [Ataeniobius toweri]|uniref:Uncharacterized protein n=1 Tax=Ataeniobius toweri TaxID=208326 RepID=A0ABU7BU05_9TELE|nr:hypothetical protein [Ataeniobius toweri]